MSKKEELKATYLKDLESMAAKSRFGYFSILPNPQAGCSSPERSSRTFPFIQSPVTNMVGCLPSPEMSSQELQHLASSRKPFFISKPLSIKETLTPIQVKKKRLQDWRKPKI